MFDAQHSFCLKSFHPAISLFKNFPLQAHLVKKNILGRNLKTNVQKCTVCPKRTFLVTMIMAFLVMMTIFGHIDISVSLTTWSHSRKKFTSTRKINSTSECLRGGQKSAKSRENKQQCNLGILCDPEKIILGPGCGLGPRLLHFWMSLLVRQPPTNQVT